MKICLVSSGLNEANRRLQPWHYLFEIGQALAHQGHNVILISDGNRSARPGETVAGLPVIRLGSRLNGLLHKNAAVIQMVRDQGPDVALWHVGMTSFAHLGPLRAVPCPVIGVFTSPVYRSRELLRPGIFRLLRGHRLSAVHLLGLLMPDRILRRAMDRGRLQALVVECETTRRRLAERGVTADRIQVLRPSIDQVWLQAVPSPLERARSRDAMGLPPGDFVVGYFGPPGMLRGLAIFLKAVALLQQTQPVTRALVLSRERDGELRIEGHSPEHVVGRLGIGHRTHLVRGFLSQGALRHAVAACDAVALPLEIVPSDVPLSVLETMALGLPLVTTDVACLPELVPDGAGLVITPGKPALLAGAIHVLAKDAALRERLGLAARRRVMAWQALCDNESGWTRLLNASPRH